MTIGMRLLALLGLSFIAALVIFVSTEDTRATAPPFQAGGIFCLENYETEAECDGDPSPGGTPDIRNRFCVGYDETCVVKDDPVLDSNFGPLVSFVPTDFTVPEGTSLPLGAIGGHLSADAQLGLLGSYCSNVLGVAFTMMNASIDISDTIAPKPVGEKDVMEPLALDVSPKNGLPDGIDHYPSYLNEQFNNAQPRLRLTGVSRIQSTWVVLNFVFFEPGATLELAGQNITFKPELGYPSQTILQDPTAPAAAGAISDFCAPLLSQSVIFGVTKDNPCTGTPTGVAGCPDAKFFENRGYPLLPCENGNTNDEDHDGKINDGCPQVNSVPETGAQCDNDISDDPEDSTVNDGCPQVGEVSENSRIPGNCSGDDEGGCIARTSPTTAGTYTITMFANSQRDADGDGIENSLDVCFDKPNGGPNPGSDGQWNPRGPDFVNDADNDGLPKQCDPDDSKASPASGYGGADCAAGFTGPDEDQDCFSNRQDNCPLVKQVPDPTRLPNGTDNKPNPEDRDSDGIGDACDPHPDSPDGDYVSQCMSYGIQIGAGASTAPVAPAVSTDSPNCIAAGPPQPVTPTPVGQTPTPKPAGPSGVLNGPGDGGVGSLAPTGTNVSLVAIGIAAAGAIGVGMGLGILRTRRVRRRD